MMTTRGAAGAGLLGRTTARASGWVAASAASAALLSGCFATQQDIRVLQGDLALVRAERAPADSAHDAKLNQVLASLSTLSTVNDSMRVLTTRMTRFASDITTSMQSVEQQLLQIQELTGQSQRKLQEMRAAFEERQASAPPPPVAGGTPGSVPEGTPGPNQLLQMARQQQQQGSTENARTAYEDLLRQYPDADIADDALFYIGETYAAEKNAEAADSVYALVSQRYPKSTRSATAMYRRGVAAKTAGKKDAARTLFKQVIAKYPNSDEAELARDRLRELK